jgi:hypothetical protein
MSLQALRRWIARHPLSWVLGLALALGGAQFAATAHAYTHVATAAAAHDDTHVSAAGHDCPTCLLAAALGGAAPAPTAIVLVAPQLTTVAAASPERAFFPRVTLPYASRAPPAQPILIA